jgi:hypothetical protein
MLWLIPMSLWLHILPALGSSPLMNGNNNHFILVKEPIPVINPKRKSHQTLMIGPTGAAI